MGSNRVRVTDNFPSEAHAGCKGTVLGQAGSLLVIRLDGGPGFFALTLPSQYVEAIAEDAR